MNNKNVLVVKEEKETIDKISKGLKSKRRTFEILGSVGETITKFSGPVFIGSILSPFDIEGPIVEIITGVALASGYFMEKISKSNIDKIDAIITNGESGRSVNLDKDDVQRITNAISHLYKGVKEKQSISK